MSAEDQKPTPSPLPPDLEAASQPSLWRNYGETIRLVAIALVLAVVIRLLIAEPRYIPSDSMLPTLEQGDRLVIEKVSYYLRPPQRGDIVVFAAPPALQQRGYNAGQAFIKRVVGQPGQTVAVQGGQVYIDGEPLTEPYIADRPRYTLPPVEVPPGQYFVMGDNRNNSNDSHIWGFLPRRAVIGRAIVRFWPWGRGGWVS